MEKREKLKDIEEKKRINVRKYNKSALINYIIEFNMLQTVEDQGQREEET